MTSVKDFLTALFSNEQYGFFDLMTDAGQMAPTAREGYIGGFAALTRPANDNLDVDAAGNRAA